MSLPVVRLARGSADVTAVSALFLEYAESLNFDLCFQGFDAELASLPGNYVPPRGALLLAWNEAAAVGCVGVRPLGEADCELKRLYVQPHARGLGLGLELTDNAIRFARNAGYRSMKLDTISAQMAAAECMYRDLGFRTTAAYYDNPVEGAAFYALDLTQRI